MMIRNVRDLIFGCLFLAVMACWNSSNAAVVSFHGMLILQDGPVDPDLTATNTPAGSNLTPFIYRDDVFRFNLSLDLSAVDHHNNAYPNASGGLTTDAYFSDVVTHFSMTRDPGNRGTYDPSGLRFYLPGQYGAVLTVTDANMGAHPAAGLEYFNEHVHLYIPVLAADHAIAPFDSVHLNLYNGNLYADPGTRQYMLDTSVDGTPFTLGDIFLRDWTDLANFTSRRYLAANSLKDAVFFDNFRAGDALIDENGPVGNRLHGGLAFGGTVRLFAEPVPEPTSFVTLMALGLFGLRNSDRLRFRRR